MKSSKYSKVWLLAAICTFCLSSGESQAAITESLASLPRTVVLSDEVAYVNEQPLNSLENFKAVALTEGLVPAAVNASGRGSAEDYQAVPTALAIVESKSGYGLIDNQGHEVVPAQYKYVESTNKGQALVFSNPVEKKKAIDKKDNKENTDNKGHKDTENKSADMTKPREGTTTDAKPYVGVRIMAPQANEAMYESDMYLPFKDKETKRYGFKTLNDEVVIAPQYKKVYTDFSEDRAFVKNAKGKMIGIDSKGTELFTVDADYVKPYHNGLAEIQRKVSGFNVLGALAGIALGGFGGSHDTGVGISFGSDGIGIGIGHGYDYDDFWDYSHHHHFYGAVNVVRDKVKRGYIDKSGKVIVDSKNDFVYPMMPFGTIIENDRQLAVVNRQGEILIPFGDYELERISLSDPYIALKNRNTEKRGVLNYNDNTEVLPFIYSSVDFMNDTYIVAEGADAKHVYKMEPQREEVFTLSKGAKHSYFGAEGYAWVVNDSLLGDGFTGYKIIDKLGQVVYEAKDVQVQDVSNFVSYYSAVRVDGKWGVMDTHGHWIVEPMYKNLRFLLPLGSQTMTIR
ncbi:WG repeat-containing protein [uncultured Veillonella sp.]|uniref:WG repeat-containing protein n=1 Tax=uncultured Veillonella sp. TaxID=159268 RepID=UPI00260A8D88|nr:WG repeat-containing protein [uncultured Veillonella sp.]